MWQNGVYWDGTVVHRDLLSIVTYRPTLKCSSDSLQSTGMADEAKSLTRAAGPTSTGKAHSEFEGDYRPAAENWLDPVNARIDPSDYSYLLRLSATLNTTLDLRTLLKRTSELVAEAIPYRIFAIL